VPAARAEAVVAHLRSLRTPAYVVGEVRASRRRGRRGVVLV
jgi:hypothetical protein